MLNTRTLAVIVGTLSLALGVWAVAGDVAAMGMGAGAVGFVAGLLCLLPENRPFPGAGVEADRTGASIGDIPGDRSTDSSGVPGGTTSRGVSPDAGSVGDPVTGDGTAGDTVIAGGPRSGASGEAEGVTPDRTDALTDPQTELFSEAYLRVALDSRLASARRHLRPVAVALLEVTEGPPDSDSLPVPPQRVAESIRDTIREADIACRLEDGTFALILEDTPENGAVWTVERIRRNLVSHFGHHTLWAGVACYPAHGFDGPELLRQVRSALHSAKEWNQDRIEVAVAD